MRKRTRGEKSGAGREFVLALGLHLPGFDLANGNLQPAEGQDAARAVELIGPARGGRLVLVSSLRGGAAERAHAALELSAFARREAEELRQRFECASGPTLALLCDEGANELGELLGPLLGEDLRLFARAPLRGGERVELVAVRASSTAQALRPAATRASFLAALDEAPREWANLLWERLGSPAFGARAGFEGGAARWSDARGALCWLEARERALAGRLEGLDEWIELASAEDARGFLDAAVSQRLERVFLDLEAPGEGLLEAAFDPRQPILSEAEIAAFRD